MQLQRLIAIIGASLLILACDSQEQPPPAPPPPALTPPMPAAQPVAPAAPAIVYASADPQHGGTTQKIGDYMVELTTGADGQVDVYVLKHEGAAPSFEDVQLEMEVQPKAAQGEEAEPQDVIFYPKDGKLQGTVAGLEKGPYDVKVKVFDIQTDSMAEHTFQGVELDPKDTTLEPKHGGEVEVIDETKMEVVREGKNVKLWLRDLKDKTLPPAQAAVEQFMVNLKDGAKEEVKVEPKGDHFEGHIEGDIDEETLKVISANLKRAGEEYAKLRLPRILPVEGAKKGKKMTESEAKKGAQKDMKGTIGTISLDGKVPDKITPSKAKKSGAVSKVKKAGEGKVHSKKAGKVSKAKKKE